MIFVKVITCDLGRPSDVKKFEDELSKLLNANPTGSVTYLKAPPAGTTAAAPRLTCVFCAKKKEDE